MQDHTTPRQSTPSLWHSGSTILITVAKRSDMAAEDYNCYKISIRHKASTE